MLVKRNKHPGFGIPPLARMGGTHQAIEESKELGLNEDILTEALSLVLKTVLNPQISLAYSCFTIFCLWQAAFFPEGPLKRPQVVSLVTNGILQELVRKMFERNIKVTQANVFKLFPKKNMSLVTRWSVKRTFSVNEQHPPAPDFGQGQLALKNHTSNNESDDFFRSHRHKLLHCDQKMERQRYVFCNSV